MPDPESPASTPSVEGSPSGSPDPASPSLTSVGFLLHLALARHREGVMAAIEGSGLHPGQLAVLGALSDRGPMSQRRLGEMTLIEKSSIVLFLDALEAGGWLKRAPDPNDRRAHLVSLTPEGAARFSDLGPRLQQAQHDFIQPLGEDVQMFVKLLMRLAGSGGS
jgi:DNA-binding MarR family transcriptional regulator